MLTGDAGAIATARAHGIGVVIPADGWELPPEPTAEAKELQKLRRENEELRRSGPEVAGEFRPDGRQPTESLELSATWYPDLT